MLDAVRRAWEGQADVSLATLFAMLANRGIGWGSSDEDLLCELAELERQHPGELPLIDARVTARYLLQTEEPAHRVTVDPWRIIARRPGVTTQPGVWDYATVRTAVVGGPLVLTSADGIEHRLGVLSRITLLDATPTASVTSLDGLRRRAMGDAVYLIVLEDDSQVLLSGALEHFAAGRRELRQESRSWEQLLRCTPGEAFTVQPGGVDYAAVRQILVVEA
ncbi:hypothetical protein [Corynebacterium nasicanis]|uniref:Uncharacterized protein n=1 Tax=Corynebacterium nasicanis TaxID=1448267 RepID=A0ABW1QFA8_9CORY